MTLTVSSRSKRSEQAIAGIVSEGARSGFSAVAEIFRSGRHDLVVSPDVSLGTVFAARACKLA